ncbi:hypothetical protein ACLX1H_004542 [Fusarium chlamydosporum]
MVSGTRRVASLTASQLERKRACDREAQRTVRAKTKQHINRLEQDLEELRNGLRRDKIIRELIRQNQELKMELSAFRKSTYDSVSSAPRDSGAQMQDFAFQQWNHPMAVSSDSFGGSISESSSRSSSFSLPESTESSTWPAAFPVFPSSSSGHCSGVEDRDNSYSLPGMQMAYWWLQYYEK